mmetsp:Transcript_136460/g.345544  ORF Transcript_136460/g.345544 Transcript_136460/m.345544 type:complete len:231 (-) Transcript_136460:754-1446(-)
MERRVRQLMHRSPASFLDATPVEVVTDVQDVLRLVHQGTRLHCLCNQLLGLVVDSHHEAARLGAVLAPGVEARDEVVMVAQLDRVVPVPTGPGEDARTLLPAPVVGDERRAPLDWAERAVHAAPIADGEYVHLLHTAEGHRRPGHALVVHRHLRRCTLDAHTGIACTAAIAPCTLHELRSCKARVARRIAAGAWRRPALLSTRRRAIVHPLVILRARRGVVLSPRDRLHI